MNTINNIVDKVMFDYRYRLRVHYRIGFIPYCPIIMYDVVDMIGFKMTFSDYQCWEGLME